MSNRPEPLLVTAASFYFVLALPLLFAPQELLAAIEIPATRLDLGLLQLLGAALFGFAMLCWMSRFARIGGIFSRPLVVANFAHTMTAALLLGKIAMRTPPVTSLLIVVAPYAALAVWFGSKLFTAPREPVAVN